MNTSTTTQSRITRGMIAAASAFAIFAAASGMATTAQAKDSHVDEAAHTSAAVIAVDDHWSVAEVSGDTTWLDRMLMPDYRSISPDGKILDKPTLLAHAKKNRGSADKMRKKVEAWEKAHPTGTSVVMQGNVAILSFSNPQTGLIRSSDIFVYRNGGWHALYSQHSKAK
jgi:hypothetical protein